MNSSLYLAHAGHHHQNQNATLKGEDAVAVTAVAILAVAAFVVIFYKIGNIQKSKKSPPQVR